MKRSAALLFTALLSACSSLFAITVTDARTGIEYTIPARLSGVPGIRELAKACVTKAERVIHRTVEVDGYYQGDTKDCNKACWRSLAKGDFQYLEFNVTEVRLWDFLKEEGLWRISKQEQGDPRCESKPTSYMKKIADWQGWPMEFCLVFEKIDELKSEYGTGYAYEEMELDSAPGFKLAMGKNYVLDRATQEILGFDVGYTLFGARETIYEGWSWSCPTIGIIPPGRGTGNFLLNDVLVGK